MDRRESIKRIVAGLSAAAVGTGITVTASEAAVQEEPPETLLGRVVRQLEPLRDRFRIYTESTWDIDRNAQSLSVMLLSKDDPPNSFCHSSTLFTVHEAYSVRSGSSLKVLARMRADIVTWQILDRFGVARPANSG